MKRSDGRLIKSLDPFFKVIPYVMEERNDAQNFSKQRVPAEPIRAYLKEKREQGHQVTALHLFIAMYVRLLAQRPQLNRFVMNRKFYARKGIMVSLAVKRNLSDEGEETTVKFTFDGRENLFEIAEIIDHGISDSYTTETNSTDQLARRIMNLPSGIIALAVRFLKRLDKWNLLPVSIIDASPFHTSLFFTYLKSIRLDYVYHHLYNFGTTGLFIALGKEKRIPVVEKGQVVARDCYEIGYSMDERICDGMYFSNSWKLMQRLLANPEALEERLESIVEDQE